MSVSRPLCSICSLPSSNIHFPVWCTFHMWKQTFSSNDTYMLTFSWNQVSSRPEGDYPTVIEVAPTAVCQSRPPWINAQRSGHVWPPADCCFSEVPNGDSNMQYSGSEINQCAKFLPFFIHVRWPRLYEGCTVYYSWVMTLKWWFRQNIFGSVCCNETFGPKV